jgi:hypothetical protein
MISFTTLIQQFDAKGEKTGWTFIAISEQQGQLLLPGNKKTFRVKGMLDQHPIKGIALMPMGDGSFILPLNSAIRKAIRKHKGAFLQVQLEVDHEEPELNAIFLECLQDEPAALTFFKTLPKGHQRYFSKWIETAKTTPTQAKRIAQAIQALAKKQGFSEMLRSEKQQKMDGINLLRHR